MGIEEVSVMEEQSVECPNDVKTKRNKTTREQYYGNIYETSTGRHMSQ